ncbi:hypothetical protein J2S74_005584 [Evansella vedderi]|uniref:Uncharacterized protein n=1 Tax=Evansella vedderi TaxID=38282 RepID=A0ABU0A3Q7_9BACI|nr:YhcN/YlaJ family sporulation lipoprotein [Evansella vedderi]MDQ0258118.1 hypothetical protein [Evansella vedderi]
MKKYALSLAAAGLLVSGLAGCGDVNDNDMNDNATGFTTNQGYGTGTTGYGYNNYGRPQGDLYDGTRDNDNFGFNRGTGRTGVTGQARTGAYFDTEEGQLATRINNSIRGENIRDSRVLVHGNDVVIGVDADGDTNELDRNLRNRVGGLAGGRNVHVVTDRDQVRNIRDMDDRLRAGEAFEEIGATFTDMLNDLGNAVQRPFQRSR